MVRIEVVSTIPAVRTAGTQQLELPLATKDQRDAAHDANQNPDDKVVTTKNEVSVDRQSLKYVARAGRLPILDNETGEVLGRVFFTAYTLPLGPKQRLVR